jgi:hypothetical protein
VETLLKHRANPNVFDSNLQTPLSSVSGGAARPRLAGSGTGGDERERIIALLKQHGADEFMQRRLAITVRRGSCAPGIFTRGTNVLNRFTLLELLGAVYQNGGVNVSGCNFAFPDFSSLRIHRLDGDKVKVIPVDLSSAMQNGDCKDDSWLEWGDQVEIPERVHPLVGWGGLPENEAKVLRECVQRKVRVSVSGTNLTINLAPSVRSALGPSTYPYGYDFAFLAMVLRNAEGVNRHLRSSSDLTRVAVHRIEPDNNLPGKMTFDTTDVIIPNLASGKVPLAHTLWLRDGDVIEIPEKP